MAIVTIADENRTLHDEQEITSLLASHGIDYERWTPSHPISDDAHREVEREQVTVGEGAVVVGDPTREPGEDSRAQQQERRDQFGVLSIILEVKDLHYSEAAPDAELLGAARERAPGPGDS